MPGKGSVWNTKRITPSQSTDQLQVPQESFTQNKQLSDWDPTESRESFASNQPIQKDARLSDVYASLESVPAVDSVPSTSFIKRFKTLILILLGLITAGCVATAIAVPLVLISQATSSSNSTDTTTIVTTSGPSTLSTASTASTSASTASTLVSTASTSVSTASTSLSTASTSLSTASTSLSTASTSPSTASTSPSTDSTTVSTASTSPSTASTSPSTASTSLSTASTSPSTASTSPSTASTSPSTASTSVSTASTSPSTASTSPSTASTSVSTASTSPSTASTSPSTASTSPSTASTSVSTASTSPSTASTSPSTASTSPSTASTSVSTDSTTVSTASTSPSTASTSVSTASTSLSTASTTPATTTRALVNPCSNRIYWNVTRATAIGTGTSGILLTQVSSPTGIILDSNNNLYVGDAGSYRIMKYAPNNTTGTIIAGVTNTSGTNLSLFSTGIRYLAFDSNENLYVADTYNNRVLRFAIGNTTGTIVAGNGTFGTSLNEVYSPYGVWVDSNFNVFVAEYQNQRVTKWAPGATLGVIVAGVTGTVGNTTDKLSSPAGLYYDETNQDLYIVNSATVTSTILKWKIGASNGTVVAGTPGVPGSSSSTLKSPMSLTLDQWKNLYVADRSNSRIQLFCNGNTTGITIAGAAVNGTTLTAPYDVKLDSQMNLYVSDNSGARVSKFLKL